MRWLEASRVNWAVRFNMVPNEARGVGFILVGLTARWLRPTTYPDLCLVAHRFEMPDRRDSIQLGHVFSLKQKRVVFVAKTNGKNIDFATGRACEMPDEQWNEQAKILAAQPPVTAKIHSKL